MSGAGHCHVEQAEVFGEPFALSQDKVLLAAGAEIKAKPLRLRRPVEGERLAAVTGTARPEEGQEDQRIFHTLSLVDGDDPHQVLVAFQAELLGLGLPLRLPQLTAADDRVMLCGSPGMLRDLKKMLEERGFKEGNTSTPGDFVVERAFAEQ